MQSAGRIYEEFEEKNKTCMAIGIHDGILERGKGSSILCVPVCGILFTDIFLRELKTLGVQLVERMNGQEEEDLAEDGSSEGAMPQMVVMMGGSIWWIITRGISGLEGIMEFGLYQNT